MFFALFYTSKFCPQTIPELSVINPLFRVRLEIVFSNRLVKGRGLKHFRAFSMDLMTEPVPSSSTSIRQLGRKPKWFHLGCLWIQLLNLNIEEKLQSSFRFFLFVWMRWYFVFFQGMAERLNHSIPQHRGHLPNFLDSLQQEDNCLVASIWLVHVQIMRFERFFSFRGFWV